MAILHILTGSSGHSVSCAGKDPYPKCSRNYLLLKARVFLVTSLGESKRQLQPGAGNRTTFRMQMCILLSTRLDLLFSHRE